MNDKKSVRANKLNERKNLTSDEVSNKSSIIAAKILDLSEYRNAEIILAYCGAGNEVDTNLIVCDAFLQKKKIFFPKVNRDLLTMDFYKVEDIDYLYLGYFGIMEPDGLSQKFDYKLSETSKIFMLVPGVAFDNNLYRTGYGKGFYDRYLADKDNIYKCGLCYEIQIAETVFPEITDIQMDCIVSEERIINGIN